MYYYALTFFPAFMFPVGGIRWLFVSFSARVESFLVEYRFVFVRTRQCARE